MTHRPISAPKIGAIYVVLLAANAAVWTWAVIALGRSADAAWHRVPRLRARAAARRRRRSHRGHRQCRSQADAGGQTAGIGRTVLLARTFACRDPRRRLIAATAFALQGRFEHFKSIGSLIGTGASAFFLLAIARSISSSCARSGGVFGARAAASRSPSRSLIVCSPAAAFLPASSGRCSAWCRAAGRCFRSAFCSGSASTPRPRSRSSPSPRARLPAA